MMCSVRQSYKKEGKGGESTNLFYMTKHLRELIVISASKILT